jgi:hypothetical protein
MLVNLRRFSVPLAALLLVASTAVAYGDETTTQEINVRVLPTNALAISVDNWADFGGVVPDTTAHYDFWMNIINTTTDGWQVTVTGDDLYSFFWEGCDEGGCYNPLPTDPLYTIPKSNLLVNGGDLDWWDMDDPSGDTIVPFSVTPGDIGTPSVVVQGTSFAFGEFGLDNPMASLDLTIPVDAEQMQQYRTELVYTIMPWTP